jgi:hypothetical protein
MLKGVKVGIIHWLPIIMLITNDMIPKRRMTPSAYPTYIIGFIHVGWLSSEAAPSSINKSQLTRRMAVLFIYFCLGWLKTSWCRCFQSGYSKPNQNKYGGLNLFLPLFLLKGFVCQRSAI